MLYKCLKYDLKCGLFNEYPKYLIAILIFLMVGVDFFIKTQNYGTTILDYYFYLFLGMEEYIPAPGNKFQFPALWVTIMLYISYTTLYYPFKDLNGYGKNILLATQNKKIWYLSKCMWVVISTTIYFILAFIVLFFFAIISGSKLIANVSSNTIFRFIPMIVVDENLFCENAIYYKISFLHFVLPVFICIMNNLLQLFLSLFIKPFSSFIFTVSYTIACTYYLRGFMLDNYAMIGRSNALIENGVDFVFGLTISLIISVIVVISGVLLFSKQDILNKDGA